MATTRDPASEARWLPAVGQGTWKMDAGEAARPGSAARTEVIAALRRGIELGLTHLDTAEIYGDGEAERIVGEAIAGRRDQVILVSKVHPRNADRVGIRRACEASLSRLGTDHLDGYLLHWMGPHPFEETAAGMAELVDAGLIRWWGVSNFDEDALRRMVAVAGEGAVACNQVLYHLEERAIEHAVLPWCKRNGVAVVGYSPFGSGSFPSSNSPGGQALAEVARRHDATPRQVALAFLTRDPALYTLPKASRVDHVEDNAAALHLRLDEGDIAAVDAAFPRGPHRGGVPLL